MTSPVDGPRSSRPARSVGPNGSGAARSTWRWTRSDTCWLYAGYTVHQPAQDAAAHGIHLEVVKLPAAKRGFVLLPRRWIVERSFAWKMRFRRLVRDYERWRSTLAGLLSSPSLLREPTALLPFYPSAQSITASSRVADQQAQLKFGKGAGSVAQASTTNARLAGRSGRKAPGDTSIGWP